MAYFAALLARSADRWQARDADLDDVEDVAGLVDLMRESAEDDEAEPDVAVLLLEQEDVWFAIVRVDAEDEPRVFVSDAAAVARSAYADLLLPADLPTVGSDGRPAEAPEAAPEPDDEDLIELAELGEAPGTPRPHVHPGPAGDPDLLVDFGVKAGRLAGLCGGGLAPADALTDLAEAIGAADELEEVR